MAKERSFEFLDLVIILVKKKKLFLTLFFSCLVLSYLIIFFFVPSKYDSTALIIPSEQDQVSSFSSLLKTFSNLPIGLGGLQQSNSIDMYITIIYSRTNLEKVIYKFQLMKHYNLDSMEKTLEQLKKNINVAETKENAFLIKVRADSPKRSAAMANYIIDLLNKTIINLNVEKAQDNRIFLGNRYKEIKDNLKKAEDSLANFQNKSGLMDAELQTKATIETYSNLESELAQKEIESEIVKKIVGKESPQAKNAQISYQEFKAKVNSIMQGEKKDSPLLPLKSLPNKALEYFRYYRKVKINNKLLEFIIPLYEQSKIDEQKNIPILQVIDRAVPPEKKSYPQRVLTAVIITVAVNLIIFLIIILKEILNNTNNPKLLIIVENLFGKKEKSA